MTKRQVVSAKKSRAFSTDHITRPTVPELVQRDLLSVGMKVYVFPVPNQAFRLVLFVLWLMIDENVTIHSATSLTLAVTEGYKVKQTIFPDNNPVQTVVTPSKAPSTKLNLKRSRSENDAVEEEDQSVPKLVMAPSFNSFTSEDDWEEPEWLLPKEVVCKDVEMKEAN